MPLRLASLLGTLTLVACLDGTAQPQLAPRPPVEGPGADLGQARPDDSASTGTDAAAPPDAAPIDPCAQLSCGMHEHCDAAACVCDAGYARQSGVCKPSPVGEPSSHTQADVCARFTQSAQVTPSSFSPGAASCDPGQLSAAGVGDAVRRINFHRWLVGLAPVSPDASDNTRAQACALVSAWNPAGQQAHSPGPAAECYTADGAAGASSSNIAWGSANPVAAIDQWIEDWGNTTTMGHRRWILNPPLDPVGFGLYVGGDAGYGSAACLVVFNQSGIGPRPDFVAYPPPGFVPIGLFTGTWTFSADWGFANVSVTVTRLSDGASLPVTLQPVFNPGSSNYPNATSFVPNGWQPQPGQTYRVTITDGTKSQTYEVKPTSC